MKKIFYNKFKLFTIGIVALSFITGCSKDSEVINSSNIENDTDTEIPNGYFTASFSSNIYEPMSSRFTEGYDSRVQSLRYLVYKEDVNGNYKYWNSEENNKYLFGSTGVAEESPYWPYTKFQLILPNGKYKVIFLGNVNEKQFSTESNEQSPLITGMESGDYKDVLINLPTASNFDENKNNMFFWANVEVSTEKPNATIVLQRIVTKFSMSRETISSSEYDNVRKKLVTSIVNNLFDYFETSDKPISELISGQLGEILQPTLETLHIDYLEKMLVAPILQGVVSGINDSTLVNSLTVAVDGQLKMNEEKDLLNLNDLLNPWGSQASYAYVHFQKFPKNVTLDNVPKDFYEPSEKGNPYFYYKMNTISATETEGPKNWVDIYGFKSPWIIKRIDASSNEPGLISGTLVDNDLIDGMLLPGSLHDADSNIELLDIESNRQYHSVYSAVNLGFNIEEYTQTGENPKPGEGDLTLILDLSNVVNLDKILSGIEGDESYKANDFKDEIDNFRNDSFLKTIVGGIIGSIDNLLGYLTGKTVGTILNDVVYPTLEKAGLGGKEGLINKLTNALTPEGGISITLPLNVRALRTDNIQVSGGWSKVVEGPLPDMKE